MRGAQERRRRTVEKLSEFRSTTGGGVSGKVNGRRVLVGKPQFLREENVRGVDEMERRATPLQDEGNGVVFVAVDDEAAGFIAVADPIKKSTPGAIEQLHKLGLKIIMLTGDNERTARRVAEKLGIDEVEAGVEPQHKNDRVRRLKRKRQRGRDGR